MQEPRRSFRELTAELIVSTLTSALEGQSPEQRGNTILVVDDFSLSIINACLSQTEVLGCGFMTICPLETKAELKKGMRRRRYDTLDVVYYLRPKKANLQRILEDYTQDVSPQRRDIFERCIRAVLPCVFWGVRDPPPDPPMYAHARLVTVPGLRQRPELPNWKMALQYLLRECEQRGAELDALNRLMVWDNPVPECIPEYMAYAPSLFSLDTLDSLSTVYSRAVAGEGHHDDGDGAAEDAKARVWDHLDAVAHRLASACIAINELPYIRYSHSGNGIAELVAKSLNKCLKMYKAEHPEFVAVGDFRSLEAAAAASGRRVAGLPPGQPMEPATVIVVDRVDDLGPALMHDITYTSLVHDLLSHDPFTPYVYEYKHSGKWAEKDVLLDEADPVWRLVRYEDMGSAIELIAEGVRVADVRDKSRHSGDPADLNEIRKQMLAVASDEKLVDEKFTQHYRIQAKIVEKFNSRNMHDVAELEQILLTGVDNRGQKVSGKEVEQQMRALMQDARLTSEDQARILALFILCHKSVDLRIRNEFLALSAIEPKHQTALLNLVNLHIPVTRTSSEPKSESAPFYDEDTLKRNKKAAESSSRLCRYISKLEDVVQNHVTGALPEEQYPWMRAPPSRATGEAAAALTAALPNSALRQLRGEGTDAITAAVLAERLGGGGAAAATARRRVAKSRLATGDGGGAPAGVAAGGGGGPDGGAATPDPFVRALERPRPRHYVGGRVIVFVVGGITPAEVAAMDRLSATTGREVICGGTSILTPRDLLEQLYMTDEPIDDDGVDAGAGVGGGDGD